MTDEEVPFKKYYRKWKNSALIEDYSVFLFQKTIECVSLFFLINRP